MDKTESEKFIESIRAGYGEKIHYHETQIANLKSEMDAALEAITKATLTLCEGTISTAPKLLLRKRSHRPIESDAGASKAPSAKSRILSAKPKLRGKFSRQQLKDIVDSDGYGEMRPGTFAPPFADLVGKEIIEYQKALGGNAGVYVWAEDLAEITFKEAPARTEELF